MRKIFSRFLITQRFLSKEATKKGKESAEIYERKSLKEVKLFIAIDSILRLKQFIFQSLILIREIKAIPLSSSQAYMESKEICYLQELLSSLLDIRQSGKSLDLEPFLFFFPSLKQ